MRISITSAVLIFINTGCCLNESRNTTDKAVEANTVKLRGLQMDEDIQSDQDAKSKDIKADLLLMWKTVPVGDYFVSPTSAINAAQRVFNTISLKGKTKDEVILAIGHNKKSNNSSYNFKFYSAPTESIIYRFDNGCFGLQVNVVFDQNGKVQGVDQLWIE